MTFTFMDLIIICINSCHKKKLNNLTCHYTEVQCLANGKILFKILELRAKTDFFLNKKEPVL